MAICINNISQSFNGKLILDSISLTFQKGKIHTILGPSGCGKSTLLNIINKTLAADSGTCICDHESISQVFQEPRLLPWKTVKDNILYVLPKPSEDQIAHVTQLIEMVGLKDSIHLFPHQLSGGMQQRCALARAFSVNSSTVILDEPFKGLDQKIKRKMFQMVVDLWNFQNKTLIFITHEVDEALLLSHNITLLSDSPASIIFQKEISSPINLRNMNSDELLMIKNQLHELIHR